MRLALYNEAAAREIVQAKHSRLATNSEVLVRVRDCNRVEFVCFPAIWARFENGLGKGLPQVPIRDLLLLTHSDEFVIIERRDGEGVEASHTLSLRADSLLGTQVPAQNRLVASACKQMLIIWEELNLSHAARVLLKVRNELTRADLPDSDFALHSSRADELAALGQANRSNTTLVGVVDLPEKLAVVNSVCPNLAIRPAAENDLVCEDGAERMNATSPGCLLCR